MVYVTGDMHGDIGRFSDPVIRKLKKNDILIVCGDFGFFWDGSRREKAVLKKIMSKNFTVAFVDGCHENFDILEKFPVTQWNGGKARIIGNNIVHLMRGQVYNIENKKFFTFGGGHSQDFDFRDGGDKWWIREQPTHAEIREGLANLEKNDWNVNYIITHEPPASLKDCLGVDVLQRLEVHLFFEDMIKICKYEKWFFGKCHIDKHIPVKFYSVFNEVIALK